MNKDPNIKDELRELSPFLSNKLKGSKGGFKMPEGYIDGLADRVMKKTQQGSPLKAVQDSLPSPETAQVKRLSPRRTLAVAASVLLLLVTSWWMLDMDGTNSDPYAVEIDNIKGFSEQEVLDYMDNHLEDLAFEDLVQSGILSNSEIDFSDAASLTDEDIDMYIDVLLEEEDI